jgi:hypothetical protein
MVVNLIDGGRIDLGLSRLDSGGKFGVDDLRNVE